MEESRWCTVEFVFYYAVVGWGIYRMLLSGLKVSSPGGNPNYSKFSRSLSKGWMGLVDNSDKQYAGFRDNILLLLLLMVAFVVIKRLFAKSPKARVAFSVVLMFFIHGVNAGFTVICLLVNYLIAKADTPSGEILIAGVPLVPVMTWAWALFSLIASSWTSSLVEWINHYFGGYWWIKGGYPRWWVIYNMSILRMISFNMDYHYSKKYHSKDGLSDSLLSSKV